ncbi:energy coupling factor transporter S component ThiW [Candidatus Contubernalis alkaliaceticus]|uniref:energy coupling factor transporter S component ThiW n=1 Tax=Candidatus Contubernalis alkaliaceticus TaxID=338645 RepID=UPI001F4C3DE9|nr:energy coupling factor transporter S component ThiW [Candidatus Contubernalis alkalaceticus]UNC92237.1 energy coupling factor transporter S component ThiW [Candidatus Contubernalis alkalaceticus]
MHHSITGGYSLRKITAIGLLVAVGTIAAPFSIPIGVARVYPVQHTINVLMAVLFGPGPAVTAAVLTSIIRNLMGTGTVLAFPGSIFGALLAGLSYHYIKRDHVAMLGEILGTGLLGALAAFPLAKWLLGFAGIVLALIIPFFLSSLVGAIMGVVILRLMRKTGFLY